jgi:putative transposase
MKTSRSSEEQIIAVLKEHQAGIAVADICRKHGMLDVATLREALGKMSGARIAENVRKLGYWGKGLLASSREHIAARSMRFLNGFTVLISLEYLRPRRDPGGSEWMRLP